MEVSDIVYDIRDTLIEQGWELAEENSDITLYKNDYEVILHIDTWLEKETYTLHFDVYETIKGYNVFTFNAYGLSTNLRDFKHWADVVNIWDTKYFAFGNNGNRESDVVKLKLSEVADFFVTSLNKELKKYEY